jgi:hypothetical protein
MTRTLLAPVLAAPPGDRMLGGPDPSRHHVPGHDRRLLRRRSREERGESCANTILYLFGPNGQASVATAAGAGGLRQVRHVDNRYHNNIIRQRYCVIAYGE